MTYEEALLCLTFGFDKSHIVEEEQLSDPFDGCYDIQSARSFRTITSVDLCTPMTFMGVMI